MNRNRGSLLLFTVLILSGSIQSCGNVEEKKTPSVPKVDPVANISSQSGFVSNITYRKVDGYELELDVIVPRIHLGEGPYWSKLDRKLKPTLLYIHGGGWVEGEKETRMLGLLPFVSRGWVVVNINYRLAGDGKAPAALEDCREALNWVYESAAGFQIDTTRIVVAGESAGGHLSLMTGLVNKGDSICGEAYIVERHRSVAAIINYYGVTDIRTEKYEDHTWFEGIDNIEEALYSLSPITHLSKLSPPIISVHGDADPVVPVDHAKNLHKKLDELGAKNRMVIIPGKKHGNFTGEERTYIFEQIWDFLEKAGISTTVE